MAFYQNPFTLYLSIIQLENSLDTINYYKQVICA